MNIDTIVNEKLKVLAERTRSRDIWHGAKYEEVKRADMTPKGDFGEEITCALLNECGVAATIENKGKGEFDILLNESKIRLEHKLATQDTSGNFQFNGIKKDVNYDYVWCLGVSPNKLYFNIFSKKQCQDLTVSMTKDGSDSYKLTGRRKADSKYGLLPLTKENFLNKVKEIV